MDPCPFVRVLVGNLALKLPVASRRPAHAGVHPSTSPCFSLIRLNNLPPQTSPVTLTTDGGDLTPQTLTLAASFVLNRSDLDKTSKLKISIFTGRRGSTCGVSAGKLLGKVKIALDLKGGEGKKGVLYENGWMDLGKESRVHLTVRSEPDPRFVKEFDGEVECSPQVFQVNGRMRQPVFSCKFSTGDRHLRTRTLKHFFLQITTHSMQALGTKTLMSLAIQRLESPKGKYLSSIQRNFCRSFSILDDRASKTLMRLHIW